MSTDEPATQPAMAGQPPGAPPSVATAAPRGGGPAWWAWVLALCAVGATLIAAGSSSSLWDRDEPRNARAAVEMWRSADYLVPRFNEQLRPDKPPLAYWHMTAWLEVFGPTELAVRLPSILGMTAAVGLTGWIGAMLFGPRVGWWALWLTASSPLALWLGSAATPDGTMLPWIVLAIGTFIHRVLHGPRKWHWVALAVALGLGQLAKGPVALAVPAMTILLSAFLLKRSGAWRFTKRDALWLVVAGVAGFGMFAAWGVPAAIQEPDLLREGIGRHVLGRMTEAQEGHGGADFLQYLALLPAYIPVILFAFVPGVLLLPGAMAALLRKTLADPLRRALLWGWLIPTFVLMSLVATKLPHYVFPMFPALAIASAAAMDAWRRNEPRLTQKDLDWLRPGGVKFYAPLAIGAALGLPVAGGVLFGPGRALTFGLPGLVVMAAALSAIRWHLRSQPQRALFFALAGGAVAGGLALLLVMPAVEQAIKPSPRVAQAMQDLAAAIDPDDPSAVPLATAGFDEPSLVFYLDQPVGRPPDVGADAPGWARLPGPGVMAIRASRLEEMAERAPASFARLREVERFETVNYASHGRRQAVVVVERLPAGAGSTGP
ncbi:MAG: glycosyltransferase family 39 protein [Planctomycetota bacterium]